MPVRPVFLYRADCWAMAKQEEAMVHVIEISILRWACGVATKDGPVTKHEQQQLWRLFYSGPVCSMYLPFTVNLKVLCYTPLFCCCCFYGSIYCMLFALKIHVLLLLEMALQYIVTLFSELLHPPSSNLCRRSKDNITLQKECFWPGGN